MRVVDPDGVTHDTALVDFGELGTRCGAYTLTGPRVGSRVPAWTVDAFPLSLLIVEDDALVDCMTCLVRGATP